MTSPMRWVITGVGEDGFPLHLPMGVTADGEGPADDEEAHHYECWCRNPKCQLTDALRLADIAGARKTRAALERERETLRIGMLSVPMTEDRDTYPDGFASGLSVAIHVIDDVLREE